MKRLLLVGAGHAHLVLLERLAELRAAGLDPLLVAPRWFDYSGLATGMLSGALPPDPNRIDVAALAARRGVAFIAGCLADLDAGARIVKLEDGRTLAYDLLALNTGSAVAHAIAGDGEVIAVKPLSNLARLRAAIERRLASNERPRIVIAGAGVTGTEVAASIAGLGARHGVRLAITLIGPPRTGRGWPGLYRSLAQRGIDLLPGRKVATRTQDAVTLDDGGSLACDILVAATGLRATRPLRVDAALQSLDDPALFASGDCADFASRDLPKHGVFGVRQAPIVARNLVAAARGATLARYRPQRRFLSIMDLGNGEGFAMWNGLSHRSRAALALKRRLDFAFMRRLGR